MRDETFCRLRALSIERGDSGTPAERDQTIAAFLSQLREAGAPRVVKRLEDEAVRHLYVSWTEYIIAGEYKEDILDWLAFAAHAPYSTKLAKTDRSEAEDTNVVSLFR